MFHFFVHFVVLLFLLGYGAFIFFFNLGLDCRCSLRSQLEYPIKRDVRVRIVRCRHLLSNLL